jgi:hypothetical protein
LIQLDFLSDFSADGFIEVHTFWKNPEKTIEHLVAKATYIKKSDIWKVYWQRADLKWHGYEMEPEVDTLEEFFKIVNEDEFCCFWG